MPRGLNSPATCVAVFLVMLAALVHVATSTTAMAQKTKPAPPTKDLATHKNAPTKHAPEVRHSLDGLPAPVLEMRDAILAAVRSGRVEELLTPIEMNELKPNFGDGPVPDPIAHLKASSQAGDGKEVLDALEKLLEAPYAIVPLGRDLENNRFYVWPAFAETGVSNLASAQQAELRKLAPGTLAEEMIAKGGRYTYWRVAIAADGTWHVFSK